MAKILFIQEEASEKFGTMILSAVLKKEGHEVEMYVELLEKKSVLDFVRKFQPNYIAFSITTLEKPWAISTARKIKREYPVISIFGGAEPTYEPSLIYEDGVDIICRGEGEHPLTEVLRRLENNKSLKGIKNIWAKENGKVIKNELGELLPSLDGLPLPDREVYYKYPLLKNLSTKKFLCSRGCPYNCTYCSNHAYKKLFRGLGNFIRFRDPKSVIREIKEVRRKYGFKNVYFADETFTLNHPWLYLFLKLYRKEIKVPFSCLGRVNELDEKTVRTLKESGCFYIAIGLESGSDRIRNVILKRNMTKAALVNVGRLLNKYKLPFLLHQMFVLPSETLGEASETVEMGVKMGADSVWSTVFQPLPNTQIYRYCQRHKLLPKNLKIDSMFGKSIIKNKDKRPITNLRKLAWLPLKIPFTYPTVMRLVHLPDNIFFELFLKVSEVYSIRRRWKLSPVEMFRLAWKTGNKLG